LGFLDVSPYAASFLEPDPQFELRLLVPGPRAHGELPQFRIGLTFNERDAHVAFAACTGLERQKDCGGSDPGSKPTRHACAFRCQAAWLKRTRCPTIVLHDPPMRKSTPIPRFTVARQVSKEQEQTASLQYVTICSPAPFGRWR
jgi:hypothetical protein